MTEILLTPDQDIQIIPDPEQVLSVLDPGAVLVTFEPDTVQNVIMAIDAAPVMQMLVLPEIQQIAIVTEGPQGPAGGGTATPESVVINRTDGDISSLDYESGKTITITREDGEIISVDDGSIMKTIVREAGQITQILVS